MKQAFKSELFGIHGRWQSKPALESLVSKKKLLALHIINWRICKQDTKAWNSILHLYHKRIVTNGYS